MAGTVCEQKEEKEPHQMTMFEIMGIADESEPVEMLPEIVDCKIYDWREDKSVMYKSMKEG